MEQRALLPVRFGTLVADDAAAAAAVAGRGEALAGALRRVRGAVELSVRAVAPDEPGDGRARASTCRPAPRTSAPPPPCTSGWPPPRASTRATTVASCCGRRTSSTAPRSTASSRSCAGSRPSTRS